MADNPFNQNQWPDKGQGGGSKPNVDIRTSASDMKSVADSGGGSPKPYTPATPPPSDPTPVTGPAEPTPVAQPKPEPKQTFNEVFPAAADGKGAAPAPMNFDAGGASGGGSVSAGGMEPKKSSKGLFIGILTVIIIIGLVALGYFFVYPVFFGGEEVADPIATSESTETETPETETPSVPEVPTVTGEEAEIGTSTAPEESSEEEPPTVPSVSSEHNSLFASAADASGDVTLSEVTVATYQSSLEFTTAEVAVLEELVFKNSGGEIMTFGSLAGALLPDLFTGDLSGSFEDDFTFFTYTDGNGTWPGFVAKLKSGSTLADVQTEVANLEVNGNLANFYLSSPGSQDSWKSGTVEGVSNRYLSFSLTGASLNYGWSGDLLVVSASFPGFREALKRL